jgi:hypothetical protein
MYSDEDPHHSINAHLLYHRHRPPKTFMHTLHALFDRLGQLKLPTFLRVNGVTSDMYRYEEL